MPAPSAEETRTQVDTMKAGIREIAHDLSTPLGVLRMATYYLQVAQPDGEKRDHYFKLIAETIDKVESDLKRLRALCEGPPSKTPQPPTAGAF
jgi:nitrogen-specific signal transduction histidine kinase